MWAQLGWAIVMMIISAAISYSMAPKPQTPTAGNLDTPTADEGGDIPVVFGTVVVKSPNVVWYGDGTTQPIHSSGGKK